MNDEQLRRARALLAVMVLAGIVLAAVYAWQSL